VVAKFTYCFSGGVPYPLDVGTEVSATVAMKITVISDQFGTVLSDYPYSMSGKFRVVGEESYLVKGQSLMSTKVIVLEGSDALLATVWVLDSIGWFGKVVIEPDKDYIELTDSSYFPNPRLRFASLVSHGWLRKGAS
jgi:hypothetical protein